MITVSLDSRGLDRSRAFLAAATNQLPFATSVALNRTARDVQQALKAQTTQSFNQPTAFTRNAFRYTQSSKASLLATVFSSPDRSYIPVQSFGGQRRLKGYEAFIRGLAKGEGSPLPNRKIVPTRLAVNQAGNPKRSLFSQIESGLSTTDQGGFFIGTPRGGSREPGVYRRSRGRLFPYFIVADSEPLYRPLFPFNRVGQSTIKQSYPLHISAAVEKALQSARR